MKYRTGETIELGDSIEGAESPGVVIAVPAADGTLQALAGFEWTAQAEVDPPTPQGLWVHFANGAIVHFGDATNDEDLKLVARAQTRSS